MRAHAAVGGGGTVSAPVFNYLSRRRDHRESAALESLCGRAWRIIGRAVLGLPPSTWMAVDITVLFVGVYAAFAIFPPAKLLHTPHVALWQATAVFAFALIIGSLVFGLYERETLLSRSRIVTRLLLTTTAAIIIAYAIIYVIMYATVGRRITAVAMSLFVSGGAAIRLVAWWAIHRLHCGLLVVGPRALLESFEEAQANDLLRGYRLVGYTGQGRKPPVKGNDPYYVGPIHEQVNELRRFGVTDIVVGGDSARDPGVMEWMVPCLQRGCRVTNEASFYEKATGQILIDEITPAWFLFADLKVHCDKHATLKRMTDLVIAGVGLCMSAPLWPLIALAVKLCDGGPVCHTQNRVGQNGRIFKLYKFRTMRPDAENGKSVWCAPNDPRVTRAGRFLRRSRLDELPQLYNVLVGQMSVVGPRPERPDIVRELCKSVPYYAERHLVKPGITGWAQINYRYGCTVEDARRKQQFDLYYLKHMSLELDAIILFRTAGTFLRGAS